MRPARPHRPRSLLRALAAACALGAAGCAQPAREPVTMGEPLERPERYAHSIAALGFPGARRAFQVGPGSVVGTGEVALEWTLAAPAGPVRTSPVWFERDGVPVAHWMLEAPGVRVRFEAAAAPAGALGDTSLVASVRVTAEAVGPAPVHVALAARVRSLPDGPHAVPWDAPELRAFDEGWQGTEALRDGRLVAAFDREAPPAPGAPTALRPTHTEGIGPGALAARLEARLGPGESRAWDFWMPLYPLSPSARRPGGDAQHATVVSRARRWWRETLDRATGFETPDTLLNAAWRAAVVTLVQDHERDGGRWIPIGNPFQYRDVWLRDGARVVRALAVAGLHDLASDDARSLAEFQLPSGALLSQRGQLDGTGQALWAFEQASALANDAALARELAPVAERAVAWLARQRLGTSSLGLPFEGLLPFGDPRDGELVRAQLTGNDAWAIAGCEAAAALLTRADDLEAARRAADGAAEHRHAFAVALARVRHPDVPPSWQGGGRDWGNTSLAYPTRVLAPPDPRLAAMARRLLEPQGVVGLASYGSADSLHTYLGADLAQWALLAGRPALARGWLAALIAHSSSTLGQAEIFHRVDGGFGANLPPHSTAAACLVDLLRATLLADLRDTLDVALGADTSWWRGARLERAPTRFGVAGVRLERPDAGTLRARLDPLEVPVRVRVPEGLRAVEALSSGARVVDGRWVEAPPGAREVRFTVAPEGAS
jgi:hypothetical protein